MEISKSFCFIKNDCLTKKGCLKESWIYSFYCTNLSICLVDVLLFLFVLFCLNTHYMWFIEGQDSATEAVEPSLWVMGKQTVKCIGWSIAETRDSSVEASVPSPLSGKERTETTSAQSPCDQLSAILSVGWIKLDFLLVYFPMYS